MKKCAAVKFAAATLRPRITKYDFVILLTLSPLKEIPEIRWNTKLLERAD